MPTPDERFTFMGCYCGENLQVLRLDEKGEPQDWDEAATRELYREHVESCAECARIQQAVGSTGPTGPASPTSKAEEEEV